MKGIVAFLVALSLPLAGAGTAGASHGAAERVSFSSTGGNGANAAVFRAASSDGSRVFFQTDEALVAADTDTGCPDPDNMPVDPCIDVYERSGGAATLLSIGSIGGSGAFPATFLGASQDGTRVFFRTKEKLEAADTDSRFDVYMRSAGTTTRISVGAINGNGAVDATYKGISQDGTRVFFDSAEQLVASDTDGFRDLYQWLGGTTTLLSTGPAGGNGAFDATLAGASADGTVVIIHTDEALVSSDTEETPMQDVYQRSGGSTTHLSIGPAGGNGSLDFDYDAFFRGISADGSKVWLSTDETLTFDDTDEAFDVYERLGASITRVSTGPGGGNGTQSAFFWAASQDGSKVFFDTQESLVAADTDSSTDIYERSGGTTTLVSAGQINGNGALYAAFAAISSDGSRVFFTSPEQLVSADTDTVADLYERSGGTTTLVSTGPDGGNMETPVVFGGVSTTGTRAFFSTDDPLLSEDTDLFPDVFERSSGSTTRLSLGAGGGNGDFTAWFAGMTPDGSRVYMHTDEVLVAADTDLMQDVYQSSVSSLAYARTKAASPLRVPLVPAQTECSTPSLVHGVPLSSGSCNPPAALSSFLTVGTPAGEGGPGGAANSTGFVRLKAEVGNPSTPADEADVTIRAELADVRCRVPVATNCSGTPNGGTSGVDYQGQLQLRLTLRVTDKYSGPGATDPATAVDYDLNAMIPCTTTTADTTIGSSCTVLTTADTLTPGFVPEGKRTVWEVTQVRAYDGGADGVAGTAPNDLFMVQGLFAP